MGPSNQFKASPTEETWVIQDFIILLGNFSLWKISFILEFTPANQFYPRILTCKPLIFTQLIPARSWSTVGKCLFLQPGFGNLPLPRKVVLPVVDHFSHDWVAIRFQSLGCMQQKLQISRVWYTKLEFYWRSTPNHYKKRTTKKWYCNSHFKNHG